MTDEATSKCHKCGASVYRAHLDAGIARYEDGELMCPHCVSEFEKAHDKSGAGGDDSFAPITFDDEDDHPPARPKPDLSSSRIHAASAATLGATAVWDENRFHRPLSPAQAGATRCRTFHAKLSAAAIDFMNNQINDWLDNNEKIVIKFATSTIGPFEGKHTEPNIIVTVFY
ncbi:MAG: hypothetical protein HY763_17410 [Planctomycetes bacterium]|nr:hypothetical protein [Planctomycetota bacterium]